MAWLTFASGALATIALLAAGLLGWRLPLSAIIWAEGLLLQAFPVPPARAAAPALARLQES